MRDMTNVCVQACTHARGRRASARPGVHAQGGVGMNVCRQTEMSTRHVGRVREAVQQVHRSRAIEPLRAFRLPGVGLSVRSLSACRMRHKAQAQCRSSRVPAESSHVSYVHSCVHTGMRIRVCKRFVRHEIRTLMRPRVRAYPCLQTVRSTETSLQTHRCE